jgi:glucuronoarabinoxylan endo-1,4-beta-xylanase
MGHFVGLRGWKGRNMMKKNKKTISFGYPICVFLIVILTIGISYGAVSNVLINPGFEDGNTNGWVVRGNGVSISAGTSSPSPYSGSYRGRATGRTNTWMGIQQDIKDKVVIGQAYLISGRVRTSTTASSAVKISIQKTDNGTTTYATVASGTASSSGWVLLSGSYTVPAVDVIRTELYVYFEGPASGIDIYVDDANVLGQVPSVADPNATGQINFNVTHQTLEGFGASGAWYEGTVITLGNSNPNIYNILFRDLGIDIYRVRNTYEIDNGYITRSATIIANGETALGHPLRIMNTSWSPPARLKSNGSTVGGTLAKDGNGNYRYADFAQWWADSLTAWSNAGVDSYYLNMQNEPGWLADWDTCKWDPTENSTNAGYQQGFAALYTNLNTLQSRPILLAPEGQDTTSTPSYVNALTTTDKANVYGYSHHLYDGDANNPDGFISKMTTLKAAIGGDNKPLLQTEFSRGGLTDQWANAMNLAKLMHNALTIEEVSAYLYWELFWASPSGLVSVTNTSYTINPIYYAMMHYSRFTDPNWQRIDATTTSSDLKISAYKDPTSQYLSAVIINTSATDMNLTLSFTGFTVVDGDVWRSTSSQNCVLIGSFIPGNKLFVPANSITTLALAASTPLPPGQASSPVPSNGATNVSRTQDISWTAGSDATSRDVYFGTVTPPVTKVIADGTVLTYNTGTMAASATYYWRVDEKNSGGTTTGTVWSFTTVPAAPGQAGSPVPSTGATNVSRTQDLSWTAGSDATSRDVYFGTVIPPVTKVIADGTALTYDTGTMAASTTYHWRVDEKNAGGTTTGTVWSFTTVPLPPGAASSPVPSTGATNVSLNQDLSWSAGSGIVTSRDVYFGTVTPPVTKVIADGTALTYDTGTMAASTTYYWRVDEKNAGGTTTGTVWSFTTVPAAPGQASSPVPSNGATNVSLTQDLSWTAGSGATSHDVYFGTVNPPPSIGNQAGTTYDTGTMTVSTTYYWRVDEKNAGGTTTGAVWSFATVPPAPSAATNPNPANTATNVSLTATLSWTAGSGAASHDVYFGTAASPPFIGNQAGTTYNPGTMVSITTYYWRIDEKNAGGTTTGTVWSFTTQDIEAPLPNPIVWEIGPNAISSSSITMTATAADISGVEYYFANVTDPNHDSNWVSSPVWTDTGLVNNTTYTYQVKARDMSINHNETGWSNTASATTWIYDCTGSIVSDLDGDCEVDFFDYALLVDGWTGNLSDIAQFAIDWLTCNRDPVSTCWQ